MYIKNKKKKMAHITQINDPGKREQQQQRPIPLNLSTNTSLSRRYPSKTIYKRFEHVT